MSGSPAPLRILELYCGIGGLAEAVRDAAQIAAAVDINRSALAVYGRNFLQPTYCRSIESLPAEFYNSAAADLWWLSPPCQPFTRRGRQRDLDDPRCESLINVVRRIAELRPRYVALENVPQFAGSRADALLRETLDHCGYTVREQTLCPTQLGIPNRRQRFYLVAGRTPLLTGEAGVSSAPKAPLADFLDAQPDPALYVASESSEQLASAMHVVDVDDPHAITSCFTSAYGRSPVRAGSYLREPNGRLRRFSPAEILRLLGFRETFQLPDNLPAERAWPLVGNSLSVPAVRQVLIYIPELAALIATAPAEA